MEIRRWALSMHPASRPLTCSHILFTPDLKKGYFRSNNLKAIDIILQAARNVDFRLDYFHKIVTGDFNHITFIHNLRFIFCYYLFVYLQLRDCKLSELRCVLIEPNFSGNPFIHVNLNEPFFYIKLLD